MAVSEASVREPRGTRSEERRAHVACRWCVEALISTTVLIVDDNDFLRMMLARLVSRWILDCNSVRDADAALSEVDRIFYDLVFLDVHLPDANGLDLLPKINLISPDTKVVIMSSDGSETNVRRALTRGALRFLQKPFDSSEIDEIIKSAFPGLRSAVFEANHQD